VAWWNYIVRKSCKLAFIVYIQDYCVKPSITQNEMHDEVFNFKMFIDCIILSRFL